MLRMSYTYTNGLLTVAHGNFSLVQLPNQTARSKTMTRAPPERISWPRLPTRGACLPVTVEEGEGEEAGLGERTSLGDLRDSRGGRDMRRRDGDLSTDLR